jgi:hypothetical protein
MLLRLVAIFLGIGLIGLDDPRALIALFPAILTVWVPSMLWWGLWLVGLWASMGFLQDPWEANLIPHIFTAGCLTWLLYIYASRFPSFFKVLPPFYRNKEAGIVGCASLVLMLGFVVELSQASWKGEAWDGAYIDMWANLVGVCGGGLVLYLLRGYCSCLSPCGCRAVSSRRGGRLSSILGKEGKIREGGVSQGDTCCLATDCPPYTQGAMLGEGR